MTSELVEDPTTGYFNVGTGRHPLSAAIARFRRLRKLDVNFERVTELAPELLDVPLRVSRVEHEAR